MAQENCTFHSFKTSGKWYATGRGYLSESVFQLRNIGNRRECIRRDNDGKYPGLSSGGHDLVFVVVPDEDAPGYPLMLHPAP